MGCVDTPNLLHHASRTFWTASITLRNMDIRISIWIIPAKKICRLTRDFLALQASHAIGIRFLFRGFSDGSGSYNELSSCSNNTSELFTIAILNHMRRRETTAGDRFLSRGLGVLRAFATQFLTPTSSLIVLSKQSGSLIRAQLDARE
jgi:hypothetical protein